jgi:hypothetical protein
MRVRKRTSYSKVMGMVNIYRGFSLIAEDLLSKALIQNDENEEQLTETDLPEDLEE